MSLGLGDEASLEVTQCLRSFYTGDIMRDELLSIRTAYGAVCRSIFGEFYMMAIGALPHDIFSFPLPLLGSMIDPRG